MPKKSRRTTKERVLYERAAGFNDCLTVFEDAWRELEWKYGKAGNPHGGGDPIADFLWKLILEAMEKIKPVDSAWRELYEKRLDTKYSENNKS